MSLSSVAARLARAALVVSTIGMATSIAHGRQQPWSATGRRFGDCLGWSVTWVPDADGDGVPDYLVGVPGEAVVDSPGVRIDAAGRVRLVSGATSAVIREFTGSTAGDGFGAVVVDLGDVDGDGVRDFATLASGFAGVGPQSIVVVSGTGATIRTIQPSTSTAQIIELSYVEDVDGDGVRELLYGELDGAHGHVYLVSGRNGNVLRTHSLDPQNWVIVGRVGDVDADGVDDYGFGDLNGVSVVSGATGSTLFTVAELTTSVGPAGDVDGDGHADVLTSDYFFYDGVVRVVSGATGAEIYELHKSFGFGAATSPTGDLDHDGVPDLVVSKATFPGWTNDDGMDVYFFSGATGKSIGAMPLSPTIGSLDATADVNGDGVLDLLAGDGQFVTNPTYDAPPAGRVDVVSLADDSILAEFVGNSVLSHYGASTTIVSDRDGDGWNDIAISAPGGLDDERSVVQIVSGRDGHELSRFFPSGRVPDDAKELVSIPDVNGDGVEDLAIVCPGASWNAPATNAVEIRSGADDTLLSTIVPASGTPRHLGAAIDLDGTPLLAVTTTSRASAKSTATGSSTGSWSTRNATRKPSTHSPVAARRGRSGASETRSTRCTVRRRPATATESTR